MHFDLPEIACTQIITQDGQDKNLLWTLARLDQVHPIISGNKLFKLYEFLEMARLEKVKRISTYGGPYSNHLVATAYACHCAGIPSRAFVRGGMENQLTHTLEHCQSFGMELVMLKRTDYRHQTTIDILIDQPIIDQEGEMLIPEGGFHWLGVKGAARIMTQIHHLNPTHIVLAVGTATTLAGILQAADPNCKIIAVPVLKNLKDMADRLRILGVDENRQPIIADGFHFGGYARYNSELLQCMNDLFAYNGVPTDFVYTVKMMFATRALIQQDFFPPGSRILCLHTGGLQGNHSLPPGSLIF